MARAGEASLGRPRLVWLGLLVVRFVGWFACAWWVESGGGVGGLGLWGVMVDVRFAWRSTCGKRPI